MDDEWISHILGEADYDGQQHCIMCGALVKPHILGALPPGIVYEHGGRLLLIEPDEVAVQPCHEQGVVPCSTSS